MLSFFIVSFLCGKVSRTEAKNTFWQFTVERDGDRQRDIETSRQRERERQI